MSNGIVSLEDILQQFMSTFAEFPSPQMPGSFSIEQAGAVLTEATTTSH